MSGNGKFVGIRLNESELELIESKAAETGHSVGITVKYSALEFCRNDLSVEQANLYERIRNLEATIQRIRIETEQILEGDTPISETDTRVNQAAAS